MKNSTAETQIWRTVSNMTQKAVLITALVILSIWSFNSCENHRNQLSDMRAKNATDSTAFVLERTEDGRTIAIQEAVIVNQKSTVKELVEKVNGVNKENAQLKATVRTERTDIKAEAIGGDPEILEVHDTIDNTPKWFMRLPQEYRFEDTWMGVYYTIDTSGESNISKMFFVNKPLVTFGYQERKFPHNIFGTPIPVVAYTDKNPYAQITSMQNFVFEPKPKWYQRKGLYFAIGLIGGAYTVTKIK